MSNRLVVKSRGPSARPSPPAGRARPTALFLSETIGGVDDGANFLQKLPAGDQAAVRAEAVPLRVAAGAPVFIQGDPHEGIYLIESGLVRAYYTGPSGREITLAYWTPGHFVGGPEIYGGGTHIWSADATEDSRLLYLTGVSIQRLIARLPRFAACLIEGLVAKGKCYSALVQMLGTRSVVERLAHLLLLMSRLYGEPEGDRLVVRRRVTHDELATIVGATRQWVTITLDRFQKKGIIEVDRQRIVIVKPDALLALAADRNG